MVEHYTEAIILRKEPKGELDASFTLYTKSFGRLIAKAKSVRRITSKLSCHLTPGSIAKIRIIERNGNGYQIIDALSSYVKVTPELVRFLEFINAMTPYGDQDQHLWYESKKIIESGKIDAIAYRRMLNIIGYGPDEARCENCNSAKIAYFVPSDIMFLCSGCFASSGLRKDEVFSI